MSSHLNTAVAQTRIADLHRQADVARLVPRTRRRRRSWRRHRVIVARLARVAR
jgi:hypothetical protein